MGLSGSTGGIYPTIKCRNATSHFTFFEERQVKTMTHTISLFVLKNKTLLTVLAAMMMAVAFVAPSFAQEIDPTDPDQTLGLGDLTSGGIAGDDGVKLGTTQLEATIASLINTFIGLLGIVAVIIILIGGFQWMTAMGDEEKIGGAKQMIYAGVAGLAVILASYAIAVFVIEQLTSATGYDQT